MLTTQLGMTKGRVVLIEDDPGHAWLIGKAISRIPLPVDLLHLDRGEKVERSLLDPDAQTDRVPPDLILLDIHLPDADGLQILQRLRQSPMYHSTPIVILTSSDRPEEIRQAYEYGANSYAVKATHRGDALSHEIQAIVQYWLTVNRPVKTRQVIAAKCLA
jgi:CheY-like chemotaxis protein